MYNDHTHEGLCMGCMEPIDPNIRTCPRCGYTLGQETPNPEHIAPGTTLHDRYLVGKVLGSDRHGTRYLAYDTVMDIKAVLTCVIPSKHSDRFSHALNDPAAMSAEVKKRSSDLKNIRSLITSYDSFSMPHEFYTVRRYTDCVTLKDFVENNGGRIPYRMALKILKKASGIVHKMHQRGIIHGGISPDNILIAPEGDVYVLDGDFAAQTFADDPVLYARSGFAPIELYNNGATTSPATDVYSVAACLYYAIMGRPLPPAPDREAGYDCPAPSVEGVEMPGNTQQVMINALEIAPADRIPMLDEFFMMLKDADDSQAQQNVTTTKTKSAPAPEPREGNSGALKYVLLGVGALLVIIGLLFAFDVFNCAANSCAPATTVQTPVVTGKSVEEAKGILADAGFSMLIVDAKSSNEWAAGTIIAQDQVAGSMQPEGEYITVTVSLGSAEASIPNVQYQRLDEAFRVLSGRGIRITVAYADSDFVTVGNVLIQEMKDGSTAHLIVSKGSSAMDKKFQSTHNATPRSVVTFIKDDYVIAARVLDDGRTLTGNMPDTSGLKGGPDKNLDFAGWFTEKNGLGNRFDSQTKCSGALIVYALFSDSPVETIDPNATDNPDMSDLPTDAITEEPTGVPTDAPLTTAPSTESPVTSDPTDNPDQSDAPSNTDDSSQNDPSEGETSAPDVTEKPDDPDNNDEGDANND